MSRPVPRRRTSSRIPTSRPRRIAGQVASVEAPGTDAPDTEPPDTEPPDTETSGTETLGTETSSAGGSAAAPPAAEEAPGPSTGSGPTTPEPQDSVGVAAPVEVEPGEERQGSTPEDGSRRGVTTALLAALAVLAVVLLLQSVWWLRHVVRDEPAARSTGEGDTIIVPADHPIVPTELVVQEGVEAAAEAAQKIVARDHRRYDEQVEAAVALMTEDFAEEYRQTTSDVREEFIARKTVVQVRVVAQGAVRANDTELEALVFLNQYVERGEGKARRTVYTPYRALLTMVHTDEGWLVDDLQTK